MISAGMRSEYSGTVAEARAFAGYTELVHTAEALTTRLIRQRQADQLTVSQLGALAALLRLGPLSQGDLAAALLKSCGNITMVVDNLEKRDLVRRRRLGSDRRITTVQLTDAGRRLIETVFPRHLQSLVEAMGVLTDREQDLLAGICRKLRCGEQADRQVLGFEQGQAGTGE